MSAVQKLYDLQQIDTEIINGKKRLGEVLQAQQEPAEVTALREQAAQLAEKTRKRQTKSQDKELQLGTVLRDLDQSTQRLYSGQVKNPKELADLQMKVQSLERRKANLEDEMLDSMMALEEAQEAEAAVTADLQEKEAAWQADVVDLQKEQHALATHLNQLIAQRQKKAAAVDGGLLQKYDRLLKKKRGLAVAEMKQRSCSGCQVGFTNNVVRQVHAGDMVTCPSCGRLVAPPQRRV